MTDVLDDRLADGIADRLGAVRAQLAVLRPRVEALDRIAELLQAAVDVAYDLEVAVAVLKTGWVDEVLAAAPARPAPALSDDHYPPDAVEIPVEYSTDEFPCEVEGCVRSFSTKQAVAMHRRRAHEGYDPNAVVEGGLVYVCSDCPETFTRANLLGRHCRLVHGRPASDLERLPVDPSEDG